MMPPQQAPLPYDHSTPLISYSQHQDSQQLDTVGSTGEQGSEIGKATLFGAGKRKEDGQSMDTPRESAALQLKQQQQQQQSDQKPTAQPIPALSSRHPHLPGIAASPSRLRSSSPRLQSPASSEIFERNVQEPVPISTLEGELSPAHIPAHVITEDLIPPALEASAQAITSGELNLDEVEIVTSASHQPAAATLEGSASHTDLTSLGSPLHPPPKLQHAKSDDSGAGASLHQSGVVPGTEDDAASSYGQLDPNDVRRLSFISFKDIVHTEHQQMAASSLGEAGSRDSLHMNSLSSSTLAGNRAASPLRSPRSPTSTHSHSLSGGLTTPPPGSHPTPLAMNPEQSPVPSIGFGSPGSPHQHQHRHQHQHQHGELTIETMRQALRKTASGDLSGGRSAGMSPVGDEHFVKDASRSRTNS